MKGGTHSWHWPISSWSHEIWELQCCSVYLISRLSKSSFMIKFQVCCLQSNWVIYPVDYIRGVSSLHITPSFLLLFPYPRLKAIHLTSQWCLLLWPSYCGYANEKTLLFNLLFCTSFHSDMKDTQTLEDDIFILPLLPKPSVPMWNDFSVSK